jgi:hypothetical protein
MGLQWLDGFVSTYAGVGGNLDAGSGCEMVLKDNIGLVSSLIGRAVGETLGTAAVLPNPASRERLWANAAPGALS